MLNNSLHHLTTAPAITSQQHTTNPNSRKHTHTMPILCSKHTSRQPDRDRVREKLIKSNKLQNNYDKNGNFNETVQWKLHTKDEQDDERVRENGVVTKVRGRVRRRSKGRRTGAQ